MSNNLEQREKGLFDGFINNIKGIFLAPQDKEEDDDFKRILKQAQDDWKQAERYFESVTDPDLIDHAIFNMEAARRKYVYLLKQARERDVKVTN